MNDAVVAAQTQLQAIAQTIYYHSNTLTSKRRKKTTIIYCDRFHKVRINETVKVCLERSKGLSCVLL